MDENNSVIYLLEDDESIRKLVVYALESQNYSAFGFGKPSEFHLALEKQQPDLLLLDIMLPEEDGISILKWIRNTGMTFPVIMLTARNSEYDKVQGLDSGADDYIAKPFGIMEMMARIRAVLRRSANHDQACGEYDDGLLRFSSKNRQVSVSGRETELTNKEFLLLELLINNTGRVMTREILLETIWGPGLERENRTLDVHIRTLRAKLQEAGSYIQTVRSVGYRFQRIES